MSAICEEAVVIHNPEGHILRGFFTRPGKGSNFPVVLMAHGFGKSCSQRKFVETARALAADGIASLRFDFTGCGNSEGYFGRITVQSQVNDLAAAYSSLRGGGCDLGRVGLLGHGLGALVVCLCEDLIKAKAFVLIAPALNQRGLQEVWHSTREIVKWGDQGFLDFSCGRVGLQYFREVYAAPYCRGGIDVKAPVMVIHGSADGVVPKRFITETLENFTGMVKPVNITNGDHDLESHDARHTIVLSACTWFKGHL